MKSTNTWLQILLPMAGCMPKQTEKHNMARGNIGKYKAPKTGKDSKSYYNPKVVQARRMYQAGATIAEIMCAVGIKHDRQVRTWIEKGLLE